MNSKFDTVVGWLHACLPACLLGEANQTKYSTTHITYQCKEHRCTHRQRASDAPFPSRSTDLFRVCCLVFLYFGRYLQCSHRHIQEIQTHLCIISTAQLPTLSLIVTQQRNIPKPGKAINLKSNLIHKISNNFQFYNTNIIFFSPVTPPRPPSPPIWFHLFYFIISYIFVPFTICVPCMCTVYTLYNTYIITHIESFLSL